MTKYQCPICSKRACDSNKHLSIEKARPSNEANADIIIKCQCCKSTLLSMLFYNLTENAIKACDTNGNVKIKCQQGFVAVEDDGKGMTAEQISHITEPFYRTDKSRSRAEGGAGLGLALCKQIADAHGACMQFSSVIGKGTKVTVTFTTRQ